MELYLQNGPVVIDEIKKRGHKIFLDLKLHDIPNTVYSAAKGLAKFNIDILTVHAAGGSEMLKGAKKSYDRSRSEYKGYSYNSTYFYK